MVTSFPPPPPIVETKEGSMNSTHVFDTQISFSKTSLLQDVTLTFALMSMQFIMKGQKRPGLSNSPKVEFACMLYFNRVENNLNSKE